MGQNAGRATPPSAAKKSAITKQQHAMATVGIADVAEGKCALRADFQVQRISTMDSVCPNRKKCEEERGGEYRPPWSEYFGFSKERRIRKISPRHKQMDLAFPDNRLEHGQQATAGRTGSRNIRIKDYETFRPRRVTSLQV